jgi:hypothetical protein
LEVRIKADQQGIEETTEEEMIEAVSEVETGTEEIIVAEDILVETEEITRRRTWIWRW